MFILFDIKGLNKNYIYSLKISKEKAVEIKELKSGEKPSIVSNTMFKTMFYNTQRIKYSAKLISYFVDVSYDDLLKNIKLVKNELDKEYNDTKEERSDYVCDIDGSKINIEINNNSNEDVMERNVEYAHRLYAEKITIGTDYKYNYNQVIQFNINNFSFVGNDKVIEYYTIQNDYGVLLNNKIVFIQIYVPNLRKKWYNLGKEKLEEWERYLLGLTETDIDSSLDVGGDLDIMIDYVNEAGEVTRGTNFGESYDKEVALREEAEREGIEIGKSQGIEIGKSLIIMNLFESGMKIEEISKATKLSEEEVSNMLKDNRKYN